ncbi:MAG: hypothetical protein Q9177_000150 [Variospora cf. flavescens]
MALQETLNKLIQDLKVSVKSFNDDAVSKELQAVLHDPRQLPERRIADLATEAVDLLGELDILLEPGHIILADHFLGYTNTKCLVAAVELKVANILAQGPKTIKDLATTCSANQQRLTQILKPLYNNGIFNYDRSTSTYSNNHVSELLHSEHWTQWHNWVELYGNQFYDIARGIPKSLRDGEKRWGAQINFNTDDDMFTYFHSQGWVPQLHKTLSGGATAMAPGILADYPWEHVADKTVLDVGGGGGGLIASLLREHESMRGGVFDLEAVINHIKPFFAKGGQFEDLEGRVDPQNLIAGDFMVQIPSFEVYVMKWVLHDWKDAESVTILKNIRKAIVPGGKSRCVVLESILSDGRTGRLSRYGDINMMMTANGQERTEMQWRQLAEDAGWKVTGIFPMRGSWVQAIELKP